MYYNKYEKGYWTLNGKKIDGSIIVNEDIELFADYSVLDISDEELDHLTFRDLSKFAFPMDCFTVILFKINLDGITNN
jgi:hypothetical protein